MVLTHVRLEGADTKRSENYTPLLAVAIAEQIDSHARASACNSARASACVGVNASTPIPPTVEAQECRISVFACARNMACKSAMPVYPAAYAEQFRSFAEQVCSEHDSPKLKER